MSVAAPAHDWRFARVILFIIVYRWFDRKTFSDIAAIFGVTNTAKAAITAIRDLIASINAPASLKPYIDGKNFDIDDVVKTVISATGHIKCNPRLVDENAIKDLLLKT